MNTAPDAWLETLLTETEAALKAELRHATSCDVHKRGGASPRLKDLEGRLIVYVAALHVVISGADIKSHCQAEMARWQALVERYRPQEPPAPLWLAYAQGGLAACMELRDRLERRESS